MYWMCQFLQWYKRSFLGVTYLSALISLNPANRTHVHRKLQFIFQYADTVKSIRLPILSTFDDVVSNFAVVHIFSWKFTYHYRIFLL